MMINPTKLPAAPGPKKSQGTGGPDDDGCCRNCGYPMKKHTWIMRKRCEAEWDEKE